MDIQILRAQGGDYAVVHNLMRFYVYDLSEVMGCECPDSGLFGGSDEQPAYWGRMPLDPQRRWPEGWRGYPFLFRVDGHLAGFVLIRCLAKGTPPTYEVGEFFVLRKYRRQGVGTYVARRIFDRFRGAWEVRQRVENVPAHVFWDRVISDYAPGAYTTTREYVERYGVHMIVHRFDNSRVVNRCLRAK